MTVAAASSAETAQSFVLLRLAERRFALAASQVAELVAPSRIFRFPHKSSVIEGVILRRGRMIPVADIADRLNGKKLTTRRFFLLATRQFGTQLDWVAIPVSGECELVSTDMMEPGGNDSPHVAGWLSHGGEVIEVLRLSVLTPGPAEPAPVRTDPARDAGSAFANASLKEALS